jgi:hypothetical protein
MPNVEKLEIAIASWANTCLSLSVAGLWIRPFSPECFVHSRRREAAAPGRRATSARSTDPRWMAKQMGTSLKMLFDTYTSQFDRAREEKVQEITKVRSRLIRRT